MISALRIATLYVAQERYKVNEDDNCNICKKDIDTDNDKYKIKDTVWAKINDIPLPDLPGSGGGLLCWNCMKSLVKKKMGRDLKREDFDEKDLILPINMRNMNVRKFLDHIPKYVITVGRRPFPKGWGIYGDVHDINIPSHRDDEEGDLIHPGKQQDENLVEAWVNKMKKKYPDSVVKNLDRDRNRTTKNPV